jgi:hypothetical protein
MGRKQPWLIFVILVFFFVIAAFPSLASWAPLQDVTAWVDGSYVRYKIYDSYRNSWVESSSGPYDWIYALTTKDEVMAWECRKSGLTTMPAIACMIRSVIRG